MQEELREMVKTPHKLVEIVKGTTAKLENCRGGKLNYQVLVEKTLYTFPIDVTDKEEVGDSIFQVEDKTILLMRYIKKAISALNPKEGEEAEPDKMIRWETIK